MLVLVSNQKIIHKITYAFSLLPLVLVSNQKIIHKITYAFSLLPPPPRLSSITPIHYNN